MTNSVKTPFRYAALFALICAGQGASAQNTEEPPTGFDPFIWAELQTLEVADRELILAFGTIGDGTGSLPTLPVAMLGPDGLADTGDELLAPEWVRLRGLLGNAQAAAMTARANEVERRADATQAEADAAQAEADAATAINQAIQAAGN